jgi:hypothetical protein
MRSLLLEACGSLSLTFRFLKKRAVAGIRASPLPETHPLIGADGPLGGRVGCTQVLNLESNGIQDEGFRALSWALGQQPCAHLTELHLKNNFVRDPLHASMVRP